MNKALKDMSRDELRKLAKDLKLKGYSKLNRDELEAFIKDTYRRVKAEVAQQPMSTEERLNAYTKANGQRPITARQQRQIDRMARRMEYGKGVR